MLAVKKAKLDGPQGELCPLDVYHFPTKKKKTELGCLV